MKARLLVVTALLAAPASALALGTETFGNAPQVKQPQWAEGVVEVVNLQSRVYCRWVNGDESFYYQGDARALNEALKAFAAIKDDARVVVLRPGKAETKSFQGKVVAYDWDLHVPSGIYRAMLKETHAVLTVYVRAAKPAAPADRKAAEKWIADLDDSVFRTRDAAEAELRKLGRSAKPVLQAALLGKPSAEQKARLERLLKELTDYDAGDLAIPKGLTVLGVDDLIVQYAKGSDELSGTPREFAYHRMAALTSYGEAVMPTFAKLLGPDQNATIRYNVVEALGKAGGLAKAALPTLKACLDDKDTHLAAKCKAAIEQIEVAKESPTAADETNVTKAILDDIRELKKGREKK
jgi:hypothetical protein